MIRWLLSTINSVVDTGWQVSPEGNFQRAGKRAESINYREYRERLLPSNISYTDENSAEFKKAKEAFNFIKETRRFEIELYWRRAAYFWAFLIVVFGGYVSLVRNGETNDLKELVVLAAGLIVSCAWHLTNLGSKSWQRHWEKHLDLFEDVFIGPVYKTVYKRDSFSVSKINEIVSFGFIALWVVLIGNFLVGKAAGCSKSCQISWETNIVLSVTVLLITSMMWGHGRGRFRKQKITMYKREFDFD